jgi:tRNA threonylcarbamoyl adenosine modification protein YeaZ
MEGNHSMKILALDSSTSVTSVAFVSMNGGTPEILFEKNTAHERADSSALFNGLEAAVTTCGKPVALCVGLGPGSYNGLRASIATARGFATALDLPLHAIPSPLAIPGPDLGFWAVGDARGGHYWIARVGEGTFLEEPILLSPQETVLHLRKQPEAAILSSMPLAGIEEIQIVTPSAVRLAILAKRGDPSFLVAGTPEPLYLKPPHITAPKAHAPSR